MVKGEKTPRAKLRIKHTGSPVLRCIGTGVYAGNLCDMGNRGINYASGADNAL